MLVPICFIQVHHPIIHHCRIAWSPTVSPHSPSKPSGDPRRKLPPPAAASQGLPVSSITKSAFDESSTRIQDVPSDGQSGGREDSAGGVDFISSAMFRLDLTGRRRKETRVPPLRLRCSSPSYISVQHMLNRWGTRCSTIYVTMLICLLNITMKHRVKHLYTG